MSPFNAPEKEKDASFNNTGLIPYLLQENKILNCKNDRISVVNSFVNLATELEKGEQKLEDGEFLDVCEVELNKAYEMLDKNEIEDVLKGGYEVKEEVEKK